MLRLIKMENQEPKVNPENPVVRVEVEYKNGEIHQLKGKSAYNWWSGVLSALFLSYSQGEPPIEAEWQIIKKTGT